MTGLIPRWVRSALVLGLAAGGAAALIWLFFLGRPGEAPPTPSAEYQALYDSGLRKIEQGRHPEAIPLLLKATELDPRQTMGHYQLALAYFNSGLHADALERLNLIIDGPEHRPYVEASPIFYQLYVFRGHTYSNLSEHELAKAEFLKAIELQPEIGEIHYHLAFTLLELGEVEEALKEGLEALRLGYRTYKSLFKVGMAFKKLGRHEEAERYFRESIEIHPGYTAAYHNLAQTLQKLGKKEEGKSMAEVARKLAQVDDELSKFSHQIDVTDENHRKNMEEYAQYCHRYNKLPELAACMDQLLKFYPDVADYHFKKGIAQVRLREEKEAEAQFRKALEIDPDFVAALNSLALLLAGARDPALQRPLEALFLAERARKLGYEGVEILAEALHAAGQTEDALRVVEKALEDGEGSAELHRAQRDRFRKLLQEKKMQKAPPEEKP